MTISLDRFNRVIKNQRTMQVSGKVTKVIGLLIEGHCPGVSIGSLCRIGVGLTRDYVLAEVVGFRDDKVLLMPLGGLSGITPGGTITLVDDQPKVQVGEAMLGRVLDGMLRPLDGKGPLDLHHEVPLYAKPLNPMQRSRIEEPLDLGIRALNGMLTCGKGQRLGIMAGSGVGKSVLLGMIARYTSAAVGNYANSSNGISERKGSNARSWWWSPRTNPLCCARAEPWLPPRWPSTSAPRGRMCS